MSFDPVGFARELGAEMGRVVVPIKNDLEALRQRIAKLEARGARTGPQDQVEQVARSLRALRFCGTHTPGRDYLKGSVVAWRGALFVAATAAPATDDPSNGLPWVCLISEPTV